MTDARSFRGLQHGRGAEIASSLKQMHCCCFACFVSIAVTVSVSMYMVSAALNGGHGLPWHTAILSCIAWKLLETKGK